MNKINNNNILIFDKKLKNLLKPRQHKNLIKSQFDLEQTRFSRRSTLIISLLQSFIATSGVIYKILFWEKDKTIEEFLKINSPYMAYSLITSYKNGKLPGIVFLEGKSIDVKFLKSLLDQQFNYEMAIDPSINIRVQICINDPKVTTVFDIYDDRGFNLFFIIPPISY